MKYNESFVLGDHQYRHDQDAILIKRNLSCVSICDEIKHKFAVYRTEHNRVVLCMNPL